MSELWPVGAHAVSREGIRTILGHRDDLAHHRAELAADLGPRDLARWRTLDDPRADQLLLGRMLVRALVENASPDSPADAITRECPHCGSADHGAPRTAQWRASVSHSGPNSVAALGPTSLVGIGIDLEPQDARGAGDLSARQWVRREAALKADGRGLRVDPWTLVVSDRADRPRTSVTLPGSTGGSATVVDLDLPDHLVGAVAWIAGVDGLS